MRRNYILCAASVFLIGCKSGEWLESPIENKADIRGMVAVCYRAQKDNSASGGGNTRNCDNLVNEYLRQEKYRVCKEARQPEQCFKNIYQKESD